MKISHTCGDSMEWIGGRVRKKDSLGWATNYVSRSGLWESVWGQCGGRTVQIIRPWSEIPLHPTVSIRSNRLWVVPNDGFRT